MQCEVKLMKYNIINYNINIYICLCSTCIYICFLSLPSSWAFSIKFHKNYIKGNLLKPKSLELLQMYININYCEMEWKCNWNVYPLKLFVLIKHLPYFETCTTLTKLNWFFGAYQLPSDFHSNFFSNIYNIH